jgi:FeS assembly SUF system protein
VSDGSTDHVPEASKAAVGSWTPDGEVVGPPGEDALIAACASVFDPEIPVNIYELGLIYAIDVDDAGAVKVEMTLTAPGCPVAGEMPGWVSNAVESVAGVKDVDVAMTFDPQWGMDMMSDEARLELGFM